MIIVGKKFKINNDTMTSIVIYCLLVCVLVIIVGFIFIWFDKDPSSIVQAVLTLFGTELGVCGLIKIFDNWTAERMRRKENGN